MVLGFWILVISITGTVESLEVSKAKELKLIQTRGIFEVNALDLYKQRFPETSEITCPYMHETIYTSFIAIILFTTSGRLLCMGTIIDQRHILSAKACFNKVDAEDLMVLVGYYKAWWGKDSQVVPVRRIVRHEFAIALLKLLRDLRFTPYVLPVRLPTSFSEKDPFTDHYPSPYLVVGYPVDRYDVPGEFISKRKRYKIQNEQYLEIKACTANFSKVVITPIEKNLFCTTPNGSETRPFCWGGLGSPILKPMYQNLLVQVGMAFAHNCTDETSGPLLNTRLDVYAEWIKLNSYRGHSPK